MFMFHVQTHLEDVVPLRVENHHALVKVMMLHCTRGVQNRQRAVRLALERVVRAPVVQIVAQAGHQQPQDLQIRHEAFHLTRFHHREHGLSYVERVAPVVVLDRTVVLPHAQNPPAEDLQEKGFFFLSRSQENNNLFRTRTRKRRNSK